MASLKTSKLGVPGAVKAEVVEPPGKDVRRVTVHLCVRVCVCVCARAHTCAQACLPCAATMLGAGGTTMSISQDRCDSALLEFPAGK